MQPAVHGALVKAALRAGDRVRVSAHWSSFYALRGVVTSTAPVMVLLDVYKAPIRIDVESLTVEPAVNA